MLTETMLKPINITSIKGIKNFNNSIEYVEKHPIKLKGINAYTFKNRDELKVAINRIVEVNLSD